MRDEMRKRHKPHGRHPQQRFTAVAIRAKTTPGRYADGNGLYLVVDPSGAQRWIWRGVIHGKRSDLGLGSTTLVSLATAREKALSCRRLARDGGNPKAERIRATRQIPTFKEAAERWHTEHGKAFKNAKHAAQWLSSLERDVFPTIGQQRVDTIASGDVLKVLTAVWIEKPETARRLKQRMKLVFDWAKASGFRSTDNPTDGVTKVLPRHKNGDSHHAALPYPKVPTFLTTLRSCNASETVREAFEVLILTATRTNEVLGAQWSEIDHGAAVWTIPGSRMKSGRAHRIPLSDRVLELFARARERSGDSLYVFPGQKIRTKPLSNMSFLMTLRRLKYTDITAHGFRSSFRDWAAERTNVPRDVCETALAHVKKDKAEAAYNRTDLFEKRRDLMTSWARFATGTPATVVAIGA